MSCQRTTWRATARRSARSPRTMCSPQRASISTPRTPGSSSWAIAMSWLSRPRYLASWKCSMRRGTGSREAKQAEEAREVDEARRSRKLRATRKQEAVNPISRYLCTVAAILCFALVFAAAGQGKKQPPAKPLDLNTATPGEFQQLPGIGPTTAKAIVHFREKSGPFRRVEDLLVIRGISRARLEKLRPYVTVQGNPAGKKR